jgi:hypothetical protein
MNLPFMMGLMYTVIWANKERGVFSQKKDLSDDLTPCSLSIYNTSFNHKTKVLYLPLRIVDVGLLLKILI